MLLLVAIMRAAAPDPFKAWKSRKVGALRPCISPGSEATISAFAPRWQTGLRPGTDWNGWAFGPKLGRYDGL